MDDSSRKSRSIEALMRINQELEAKVRDYETWFRANAVMLATHRIGGYCFEPSPNAIRVDACHGTIIGAAPTGNTELER